MTTEKAYAAWLEFVQSHLRLLESGSQIPLTSDPSSSLLAPSAPSGPPLKVVICSPHPDDECVMGALPLRLRSELGAEVTNLAITFGSKQAERKRRLAELESACRVLDFGLRIPQEPLGFERVTLESRSGEPARWEAMTDTLAGVFADIHPDIVFAPHSEDWHPAHIGTHHLAVEAIAKAHPDSGHRPLLLIETAYWHEHFSPNLMMGVSPEIAAVIIKALTEHAEEVRRNPYHLSYPSHLIENARRGAETVGGAGEAAPDIQLAELYHVAFAGPSGYLGPRSGGLIIGPREEIRMSALDQHFRP